MISFMNLQEVIDINLLQKVQESFSNATGLAAVTVDFRGNPITKYSNFSSFCTLMRKDVQFVDSCLKCDAFGGLEAARRETPYIYRCHSGLLDFAVPIIIKGQLFGSMLAGQVRHDRSDETKLDFVINEISDWKKNEDLKKEYEDIPVMSYDKITAAAQMMFYVINNMFENDIMNYAQEELRIKNQQLIDQMKVQSDLENTLMDYQIQEIQPQVQPRFLFSVMNTLSCLAIIEKAPETNDVILTLTEIMKYALTNDKDSVPLREEISFIEKYLKLQKLRFNDRLQVFIDIPEEIKALYIPSIILQSIVDNAVIHGIETKDGNGIIEVTSHLQEDDCIVAISDNGSGMSEEEIASIFNEETHLNNGKQLRGKRLRDINTFLVTNYGKEYQLMVTPNRLAGTTVKLKLPKK